MVRQDSQLVVPRQLPEHFDEQPSRQRIRVTYIVGSLRDAGAERRTLELLKHLDRESFSPSIILLEGAGIERARDWTDRCFVMGIPESGNSQWFRRSWSLLKATIQTAHQLREWRSDIVHAMLPASNIIGGIAARLGQVPVLISGRPCLTELYRSNRGIVALADKMALRFADVTVANSNAVSRDIRGTGGCPAEKCYTIYNGVDTERFHPGLARTWRSEKGWNDQNLVLGMIANFSLYKRHVDFVEAAAILAKRHGGLRFVMVGADRGSRKMVERRIEELGLGDEILILDSDPFPEKIFAALDIYVSTSESEGFSNVILEAMACGKPVVATDVGGNPEAVYNGVTGLLVPCASPRSIAAAAESLINDPVQRCSMGIKGRRRAEEQFSLARMVKSHEHLYRQLLSARMVGVP